MNKVWLKKIYNNKVAREEAEKLQKAYWVTPIQLQKYYSQQDNEQNKVITLSIEILEYELGFVNLAKYKNVVNKNIDIQTDLLHITM